MMKITKILTTTTLFVGAGLLLSACGAGDRLANVGRAPEVTQIVNPQTQPDYQPVSMPMPAPEIASRQPNSLWQSNRKSFFKDQRAGNIGDILTVMIDIRDKAELDSSSDRSRTSNEGAQLNNLLGLETMLDRIPLIPAEVDNANLINAGGTSSFSGKGATDREEKITMKMAATIMQILPNGNMVINGNQEVRVNYEKRILNIKGIIRPEDISVDNSISYEKIAEARITYGGKGHITDYQQPRYGQQIMDVILPF
jgi:flagellar L-ring protein precursor FlgH